MAHDENTQVTYKSIRKDSPIETMNTNISTSKKKYKQPKKENMLNLISNQGN